MLREEHVQGFQYLFSGRLAKGIEQGEGSLQRHGFAIDRESLQEFALSLLQLPGVNVIKEIAGYVPMPELSIEQVFKQEWEAETAIVTQERGQQH